MPIDIFGKIYKAFMMSHYTKLMYYYLIFPVFSFPDIFLTESAFTCSKSKMEAPQQCVKSVQS